MDCIEKNMLDIAECFDSALTDYTFTGFMMNSEDCSFISSTKVCVIQAMDQDKCVKPKLILNEIFQDAWDSSVCSTSSQSSLMFVGVAIFAILFISFFYAVYCNKMREKNFKKASTDTKM